MDPFMADAPSAGGADAMVVRVKEQGGGDGFLFQPVATSSGSGLLC